MILAAREPMPFSEIGRLLGTMGRAVRYDLEPGALWLRVYGLQLVSKAGVGTWVQGPEEARILARRKLGELRVGELGLSPQDRRSVILAALLGTETAEQVDYEGLTSLLGVSHRTVYGDLNSLGASLAERGLVLEWRPPGPFELKGTEAALRELALELLEEQDAERVWRCRLLEARSEGEVDPVGVSAGSALHLESRQLRLALGSVSYYVAGLLRGVDLKAVLGSVLAAEAELGASFAAPDVFSLLLRLAIAVRRLTEGRQVQDSGLGLDDAVTTAERAAVGAIALGLSRVIERDLPSAEVDLITLAVLTTKTIAGAGDRTTAGPGDRADRASFLDEVTRRVVDDLVTSLSHRLGAPFIEDTVLRQDLVAHLKPTLVRIAFGRRIRNPLLEQVRADSPVVYGAVSDASDEILRPIVGRVPAEEIAYIVMHAGAAMERKSRVSSQRRRALVVCPSGVATSRLLASRLEREFPQLEIVGLRSSAGTAGELDEVGVDLIISTTPLTCRHRVVVVNPLLPAGDLSQLAAALRPVGVSGQAASRGYARPASQPLSGRSNLSLDELLSPDVVALRVLARDSLEAIRAGGRLLVAGGAVEPRYVEAMVRTYREIGPYVVIAPGVALPHARPEDGVIRLGLSLVTLASPVPFGHETNDPVDMVFAFAGIDYFSHLRAFTELASLFRRPERLAALRQAESPEDALHIIASAGGEDRGRLP